MCAQKQHSKQAYIIKIVVLKARPLKVKTLTESRTSLLLLADLREYLDVGIASGLRGGEYTTCYARHIANVELNFEAGKPNLKSYSVSCSVRIVYMYSRAFVFSRIFCLHFD